MRLIELFLSFLQIGLFSIGGGYAAIPLIRAQTVELHGWLTPSQFMDLATIAEMTPGPIAINGATFVGLNVAGLPGALAATFGCILPSLVIVSILSWVYRRYRQLSLLQNMLGCLRPAVVALIGAAGLNMLLQVILGVSSFGALLTLLGSGGFSLSSVHWMGGVLSLAAFLILRKLKWSPILVMLLCGAAGLLLGLMGSFS